MFNATARVIVRYFFMKEPAVEVATTLVEYSQRTFQSNEKPKAMTTKAPFGVWSQTLSTAGLDFPGLAVCPNLRINQLLLARIPH